MPTDRNNGPSDSPGILGQMSRLKSHSGASAAELRAFVRQLRGRSPQEVIGALAQSNLLRATLLAAFWTLVLFAAFTIGPALIGDKPAAPPPAPAAAASAPATDAGKKPADTAAAGNPAKPKKTVKDDIVEKLGMGDPKPGDPKKNPLDDIGDRLFKDVK